MSTEITPERMYAAIDAGDISELIQDAETAEAATGHVILAGRACRRVRESAADAIALACEGRLSEALETADEAARHLDGMRKRLGTAIDLKRSGR
jgi:hypothetical protein